MDKDWLSAKRMVWAIALIVSLYLLVQAQSAMSWGPLNNYRNFSVRTTVNITDALPEILNVYCANVSGVTLSAGATQKVVCLVMIRDYNGADTLNQSSNSTVNGTFHYILNTSSQSDDNNVHYTNSTCLQSGTEYGTGNFYINYTCAFDVWYYANNGTWYANISVLDSHNSLNLTANSRNSTTVNPLYALNVTEEINFGDMYTGETTIAPGVQANVTNFGNMNINFTIYGYGGEDPVAWAGYAMNCSVANNISLNNERYAISPATEFGEMTLLSGSSTLVPNITLAKQTVPGSLVVNTTYWGLHINVSDNPFGICQGTVIFSAIAAT